MAENNLGQALKWVFQSEGGYSNAAGDSGGPTQYGVTQAVYNAHRRAWGQPTQSVRKITFEEAEKIYKQSYWDMVGGDLLPAGLDYATFDFGVNSGPSTAVMKLQLAVNALGKRVIPVDGVIGPLTIEAINDLHVDELITKYVNNRWSWMQRLGNFRIFRAGWYHRLFGQPGDLGVLKNALSLLSTSAS